MATDEIFEKALKFVLEREGGFVNDPNDRGGATNKGVTQNTYNQYLRSKGRATKDVRYITDAELKDIYYTRYWLQAGCDKMSDDRFAIVCFDTAVNMGVSRVREFLCACQWNDLDAYFLARIRKYNEFAKVKSQRGFLHGWLNRTYALYDFVFEL